jgi:hypothetical protein
MAVDKTILEIKQHILLSKKKYGAFASTHEAMGVALEEWHELVCALQSNKLGDIENECVDLAAVLIRLASQIKENNYTWDRSVK